MKKLLATFALGLALCQSEACAQERTWMLDAVSEDAFLVFGVPETDDVGLSFWCKLTSGKVKIYIPDNAASLKPDSTVDVKITLNDQVFPFEGNTSENETSGATAVEFEVATADPMFAQLKTADRMQAAVGGRITIYPLFDADVGGLLSLCQK
jgi:hypothetical protein